MSWRNTAHRKRYLISCQSKLACIYRIYASIKIYAGLCIINNSFSWHRWSLLTPTCYPIWLLAVFLLFTKTPTLLPSININSRDPLPPPISLAINMPPFLNVSKKFQHCLSDAESKSFCCIFTPCVLCFRSTIYICCPMLYYE